MNSKSVILSILLSAAFMSCSTAKHDNIVAVENNLSVASGKIERYYVHSDFVECRYIDVWLPENYTTKKKYPVVYMHDGQMLFDTGNTWNLKEWKVDEAMANIGKPGESGGAIIVGIYNNPQKRHIEYFPEKAIPLIEDSTYRELKKLFPCAPLADRYLKFVVDEVKPFIDSNYSTKPEKGSTFLCGSSMGGLISMYGVCEYPEVFGGAACLSTHWIGTFENNTEIPAAILKYMNGKIPDYASHKFYFDYGTIGLDANYKPYQLDVDSLILKSGYSNENFMSKEFAGDDHNEDCWAKRLGIPLSFLLNTKQQ